MFRSQKGISFANCGRRSELLSDRKYECSCESNRRGVIASRIASTVYVCKFVFPSFPSATPIRPPSHSLAHSPSRVFLLASLHFSFAARLSAVRTVAARAAGHRRGRRTRRLDSRAASASKFGGPRPRTPQQSDEPAFAQCHGHAICWPALLPAYVGYCVLLLF